MTARQRAKSKSRRKKRKSRIGRFFAHPVGKIFVALVFVGLTIGGIAISYFYMHFARLTDEKLAVGPIGHTANLYATPELIRLGDQTTIDEIVSELQRAGYTESRNNRVGWYHLREDAIEVFPGKDAFYAGEDAVVLIDGGKVSQIISLRDNTERTLYALEPELLTSLFNQDREKRRMVRYQDLPQHLIDAVIAAEDKRFFQHSGFDPVRILGSAIVNLRAGEIRQGASTLSMQVAGDLWLDRSRRVWSRKFGEVMITYHLEKKLTKEQIFEFYANQIYVGHVNSFAIHGFAQGAQAYFDKNIRQLSVAEAAMLAGMPRGGNLYSPFRNIERAKNRRDWVLSQMLEEGTIEDREYALAVESPVVVVQGSTDSGEAPYFVDLANQWLRKQFTEHDFQSHSYRVDTTIDMKLQRDAVAAVKLGLESIDELSREKGRTKETGWPAIQVAMVAIDPHTGAVKAVVGGRNYGRSQLNRAVAKRPPGSVFKPFVFAAALNTAVEGGTNNMMTTQTRVMDEPTTFWYDDKPYEPHGYKNKYYGEVTLRWALAKSLNVPTVKLAERVGYDRVVEMAQRAGMNMDIQPTPAVALGSYEVTPLEIAGAYTMFANQGEVVKPYYIQRIRDDENRTLFDHHQVPRLALDPRVSYVMTNIMEETLRSGTGVRTRILGFREPAAGKTGTSHDGWFSGFTSELLCVVWVGYDDYRDIKLEGAETALPIWTEFMKRAHQHRSYRNPRPFYAPEGVVNVTIDPESGKLAAGSCGTEPVSEVFVAGTEPVELCNGGGAQVAGWDISGDDEQQPLVAANAPVPRPAPTIPAAATPEPPRQIVIEQPAAEQPEKKKGLFGKILDIFK